MSSPRGNVNATFTIDESKATQDAFVAEYESGENDSVETRKPSRKAKPTRRFKTTKKTVFAEEDDDEDPGFFEMDDPTGVGTSRDDRTAVDDVMERADDVTDSAEIAMESLPVHKPKKTYANRGRKAAAVENVPIYQPEAPRLEEEEPPRELVKRGRKPKVKSSAFDDVVEAAAEDIKLLTVSDQTEPQHDIEHQKVVKDPVRRGRKPKGKIPLSDDVTEVVANEDHPVINPVESRAEDETENQKVVKDPVRRGRKPKGKIPLSDDVTEVVANEDHPVINPVESQTEDETGPEKLVEEPVRKITPAEENPSDPIKKQPEDAVENEEVTAKNPVRKGRKPKAKTAAANQEDPDTLSSLNRQLEELKVDDVVKGPFTRGRKLKAAAGPSGDTNEEIRQPDEASKPVRKGRKPKEAVETEADGHSGDEASAKPSTRTRRNVKPVELAAAKTELAAAKKEAALEVHQHELEVPGQRQERPRRGRPPKN